ncbi:MAG TPA: hypothetical protein VJN29_10170 [Intrasporangium sp.]|uniref:hypothetical protein n=1 Tax=Intrasporangium sp. TaxID=1925024 RepID=UPI002B4783ED|nr:hypothetical protein [Intrasporangium sp.]HKX67580.1 hypothetical protein [Intrasporangium sp.]
MTGAMTAAMASAKTAAMASAMTGAMASAMTGAMTGGMGREARNAAPEPLVGPPVREPVHRGVGAAKRAATPARPGVEGASRRSGVAARG